MDTSPTSPPASATAPATRTAANVAATESDNGKTLHVDAAAVITISLPANATTGYAWTVTEINGSSLEQIGDIQYTPERAPEGMVGTGGTALAKFRAINAGQTTIALAYARPWEKGVPPIRTFKLTIMVDKAP